jgi:cobaltochelatase CobT
MNVYDLQQVLIKTTRIIAGEDVKVYLEGFQPCVQYNKDTRKPEAIFIPTVTENTEPALIRAIHGFIDHECGHCHLSDGNDICDSSKDKLWHYLHNCIEDPRVNRGIAELFPGCAINIRNAYNFLFEGGLREKDKPNPYSREYVDSLDLSDPMALAKFHLGYASLFFAAKMGDELSGHKYNELDLDRFYGSLVDKMDAVKVAALKDVKTASDVRNLTDYFHSFFSQEAAKGMEQSLKIGKGKGKGERSDSDDSSEKGTPLEIEIDAEGRALTEEEIEKLMEGISTLEDQLAEKIKIKLKYSLKNSKGFFYWTDRFDVHLNKHEMIKKSRSGAGDHVAEFEDETKKVSNFLMKDLRRLLEERRRRYYTGGHKSGKLNSKSLFSVRCGNDRIFKKKNEIRDVNAACSLLIDMSGSMRGTKVKTAMQSAYAFAMVLQQLKIPFEVYGFSTSNGCAHMQRAYKKYLEEQGYDVDSRVVNANSPENYYAFKEFSEPFDIYSKKSMTIAGHGGLPMDQNEDSKHVMLSINRLAAREERVKALFVFSDGSPCFNGDSNRSGTKLKQLTSEAKQKQGVDIYSFGIMDGSVDVFYDNAKTIMTLSDLPRALFEYLRKVI